MKTEKFFNGINEKYQTNKAETEKDIKSFVSKTFGKDTDTLWEKGAQKMIVGSILYFLDKHELSLKNIRELFVLNELNNSRQKVVYKNLKKASKEVQVYFVGIVDAADPTFKGYVGILKSYVDILENL